MKKAEREELAEKLMKQWRAEIDPEHKLSRLYLLKWFIVSVIGRNNPVNYDGRWRESKLYNKATRALVRASIEAATAEKELINRVDYEYN